MALPASLIAPRPSTQSSPDVPIYLVRDKDLAAWRATATPAAQAWIASTGFHGEAGEVALLPGETGTLAGVLAGVSTPLDIWCLAGLPDRLPRGTYSIAGDLAAEEATRIAIGWALGSYRFVRYKPATTDKAQLVLNALADLATVDRVVAATRLVRDMVNTPAEEMGPADIAAIARNMAMATGASLTVIDGDALLQHNYPTIHAVGRAAAKSPCLIDLTWGNASDPKVTLVGKGVCFDSGGLDIKSSANMLLMKKDMGGAAHALALGQMIMAANLPVRLRVLVPAVENAISGNAFRPGDVIRTRKGMSVEITNTDAEGRLVLCDALTEADSEQPDLLLDFATLTGAARVALGPELPAMFTDHEALAIEILTASHELSDPLWRLPLWQPYRRMLDSKIAQISNSSNGTFGGAITAALYLKEFVEPKTAWAHLDLYAWNATSRPGRPEGGEAMSLRALFAVISRRYGNGVGII